MLSSCDLIAFVAATDLARSRKFYEQTLGLKVVSESSFACVFDANGMMLRVTQAHEVVSAPYTVLGWSVADIRASVRELGNRGVAFTRFDGMTQDDLGVWTSPGGDNVAWFKDPDGNTLSLTQFANTPG